MATNTEAADKLHEAYVTLLLAYDGDKSKDEKQRITASANSVLAEYNAVKKRKGSSSYAEVTGKLTAANGRLKRIRQERDKMANGLVDATRILNSITGVLDLIS